MQPFRVHKGTVAPLDRPKCWAKSGCCISHYRLPGPNAPTPEGAALERVK
jgi:hypothetical protein